MTDENSDDVEEEDEIDEDRFVASLETKEEVDWLAEGREQEETESGDEDDDEEDTDDALGRVEASDGEQL